jgi:anti-sigma28 factor (negative regulator of flagellin synthesis)
MKLNILSACKAKLSGQDATSIDDTGKTIRPPASTLGPEESAEAREERVSDLREQVQSGTYEIPVAQLVQILTSIFFRKS